MLPSIDRTFALRALAALVACLGTPWTLLPGPGTHSVEAQSIVRGEIEGVVRDAFGEGIPGAGVTIGQAGSSETAFVQPNRLGNFLVSMLEAGDYDLRVEALGYVPRLVRGVHLRTGQVVRIEVTLEATSLPPQRVDTVFAGDAGQSRFDGESSRWFTRADLAALPDPRMGLSRIAAFSSVMDAAAGSEGLPGAMSGIVLDGIPFTPARHPLQRGGDDIPLFPRSGLGYLDVHRRADVEWAGVAGSYFATSTRTAHDVMAVEGAISGSAAPLWSSEGFSDLEKPDMTSLWGHANVHVPLDEAGTRLFLGVEGGSSAVPYPSPLSESFANRLVQANPSGLGADAVELSAPWTSELQAVSGVARLDWGTAEGTAVAVRGTFASISEVGSSPFGFERSPVYGTTHPFEGTDLAIAASVLAQAHRLVMVEARAGIERSTRDWGDFAGGSVDPPPGTEFLEDGVRLGPSTGLSGQVGRTGVFGSGTAHYRQDVHWLKGGVSVSYASHEFAYLYGSGGEFSFSDPEAMGAGRGVVAQVGGSPSPSFSTPEFGLFGQYRWDPAVGVRLTAGVRYDIESLPTSSVAANIAWDSLTALQNQAFPSRMRKLSPRLGATWDLTGDGRTVLTGSLGAHFGRFDPAAFNEVATHSGSVTERTIVGDVGHTWPQLPPSSASFPPFRPTLALLGPDLQSPRTARAGFGISQRIGTGTVMHLSGTLRRTEFLLRRADLNLAPGPSGTLTDGRPTFGVLDQVGGIVTPTPDSNRRFTSFGRVWALNVDGISEHQGFTAAIEHVLGSRIDLFGSYTYSKTEDNLVGAATMRPDAQIVPDVPATSGTQWEEAISDFDIPHRFVAGLRTRFDALEGVEVSGAYRFQSGLPFTAGYRQGVDVNGDGSGYNDPAFVPQTLTGISGDRTSCLNQDRGRIATRNACRGPGVHSLDLRVAVGLFRYGDSVASLTLEMLNALDADWGVPDSALLLVDPEGTIERNAQTGVTTIPVLINPDFGEVTRSDRPGRLLRIGFSVVVP